MNRERELLEMFGQVVYVSFASTQQEYLDLDPGFDAESKKADMEVNEGLERMSRTISWRRQDIPEVEVKVRVCAAKEGFIRKKYRINLVGSCKVGSSLFAYFLGGFTASPKPSSGDLSMLQAYMDEGCRFLLWASEDIGKNSLTTLDQMIEMPADILIRRPGWFEQHNRFESVNM